MANKPKPLGYYAGQVVDEAMYKLKSIEAICLTAAVAAQNGKPELTIDSFRAIQGLALDARTYLLQAKSGDYSGEIKT
jgi:hypothetical protein